ncbi:hypothetical protein [Wolbachia endosymbiont (group A) of Oxytorus armatus]|uniref:hypothetical protein n=1 Tax=Wolbachia endosymbiont (group A) of Oxytorus armatus TaxID=3066211 RepID=UPI003133264D
MLLACYSHKHISYRIRTIIRKAIAALESQKRMMSFQCLTLESSLAVISSRTLCFNIKRLLLCLPT